MKNPKLMLLLLALAFPGTVQAAPIMVYQDFKPWFGEDRVVDVLDDLGYEAGVDYGVNPTSDLLLGFDSDVEVVIIPSNSFGLQSPIDNVNHPDSQTHLASFVQNGGTLVMHLGDNFPTDSYQAPGILKNAETPLTQAVDLVSSTHPMVLGPDQISETSDDLTQTNIQPTGKGVFGYLRGLPTSATTIIASQGNPVVAEYAYGNGRVIVTTIAVEFSDLGDPGSTSTSGVPYIILRNELAYATGFTTPTDPVELIVLLADDVVALNLQNGISNSLDIKLDAALAALEDAAEGNDDAAINTLLAFIYAVEAQAGNEIDEVDADFLIQSAECIILLLLEEPAL